MGKGEERPSHNLCNKARDDAKAFVRYLESSGNKTGTIRRRLASLTAILNYAAVTLKPENFGLR